MSYFDNIDVVKISTLLNENIKFLAHIKENLETGKVEKEETIKEHTNLVNRYFRMIVEAKNLDTIFLNYENWCLKSINNEGRQTFRRLLLNVPNFHDIGKVNPNFQYRKMKNSIGGRSLFLDVNSKHSIISAVLYIDYFMEEVKKLDRISKDIIIEYLFLNAYVISRHHGNLDSFEKFLERFLKDSGDDAATCIEIFSDNEVDVYKFQYTTTLKRIKGAVEYLLKKIKEKDRNTAICPYVYVKLMFSLLVASDFYATSEFMNGIEIENFGEIYRVEEFYKSYKNTEVYKAIRLYEKQVYGSAKDLFKEKDINILRNEMFLDAEKQLLANIDENIFFLEAPTGSGKSNVALNLTFRLLEGKRSLRKIYHVYPFNTLVEQNKRTLERIFGKDSEEMRKIAVINSITPIKLDKEKLENSDVEKQNEYYTKALLDRQFLNYPMIMTTHVSLFNTMFSSSKEDAFGFHQIANSVIVLDEIQSYNNIIWSEIITFLKTFSNILNIKIIIMSATLPDLNFLTGSNENTCNLIEDREKFFINPLFKNRVEADYSLMEKSIEDVYNHIKGISKFGGKILIEFIKKKSAYDFFERLKEDEEISCEVEMISGDDNTAERKRVLDKIENTRNIILVATQVIEAGVDIDMDIGYKDISKLDSDEQFMGRINRSCKRSGRVFFFNYDEAKEIYREDVRINKEFSLLNDEMKEILSLKNFGRYYRPILEAIKNKYNTAYNESNLEKFFEESVGKLNFFEVEKRMKLINDDQWSMSVYFARKIETEDYGILEGSEVWKEYKALLHDGKMKYAEKEVKLTEVRAKMNYFIYSVKKADILYNDRLGDLYYLEEGENYFKDGKVDKEKLITGLGDFI